MNIRFKTYSEFLSATQIVYRSNNGVKIVCRIKGKEYVVFESKFRPWNTDMTKNGFMVKLYISEVLWGKSISKKITRRPGFELLGRRCMYHERMAVICSAEEMVNKETGEVMQRLTLAHKNERPFKIMQNQIQL